MSNSFEEDLEKCKLKVSWDDVSINMSITDNLHREFGKILEKKDLPFSACNTEEITNWKIINWFKKCDKRVELNQTTSIRFANLFSFITIDLPLKKAKVVKTYGTYKVHVELIEDKLNVMVEDDGKEILFDVLSQTDKTAAEMYWIFYESSIDYKINSLIHTIILRNVNHIYTFNLQKVDCPVVDKDGNQRWYKDGKLHREDDQPAVILSDGTQAWYYLGKSHRDNDLPAIIGCDSGKSWYLNGKLHREGDQPAVISPTGAKKWYKDGLLHREDDLPAVIHKNGTKEWFLNDQRHRDNNLPALIWANGDQEWWCRGKLYQASDKPAIIPKLFEERMAFIKSLPEIIIPYLTKECWKDVFGRYQLTVPDDTTINLVQEFKTQTIIEHLKVLKPSEIETFVRTHLI